MSRFDATPRALNAFIDGELDLATQLDAEAQLARDPALQSRSAQLRELSRCVRTQADYHAAPAALRERLGRFCAPASADRSLPRRPRRGAAAAAWTGPWPAAAASMLCTAALAWTLHAALAPRADDALPGEAVAAHVRATLSQRSIDVASTDQHTVKPWLSARLAFSPPVEHPQAGGAELVGGRIDVLDGQPVAVLVYRLRAHLIDVYIWPSRGSAAPAPAATQRGFQLLGGRRHGMSYLGVSDVNADDLARVMQALTADDAAPR